MNDELKELFEIKNDNSDNHSDDTNVVKHLLIRILGLLLIPIIILFIFLLDTLDLLRLNMEEGYLFFYTLLIYPLIWIGFMLLETILVYKNKILRKTNIIFTVIVALIYLSIFMEVA